MFSDRYSRQLCLPDWGPEGQLALERATALVIGAGGLGSPAALYLTAAGVGNIRILDPDDLELSNLPRQTLFETGGVGAPKALLAKARLTSMNPEIEITAAKTRFDASEANHWTEGCDVILDCSDNFDSRRLANEVSLIKKIPLVTASVLRFEGQIASFDGLGGPCYQCVYPHPPKAPNCAEAGVLGPVAGILGTYQALEALRVLAPFGESSYGKLSRFEALLNRWSMVRVTADPDCPACRGIKKEREKTKMAEPDLPLQISPRETKERAAEIFLLDVREPEERAFAHVGGMHIPLGELTQRVGELPEREIVVYCHHGVRSLQAAAFLRQAGFAQARSMSGGIDRWSLEIDTKIPRY